MPWGHRVGHYWATSPSLFTFTSQNPVMNPANIAICFLWFESFQFSSVAQSCTTLCDPMDCSTPASVCVTNSQSLLYSCPLRQRCHPTISSSVVPFSSHLQSFPESGSFAVSQFFASGGQSIGASVSASVLPMNTQGWFPLGLSGLISLRMKSF